MIEGGEDPRVHHTPPPPGQNIVQGAMTIMDGSGAPITIPLGPQNFNAFGQNGIPAGGATLVFQGGPGQAGRGGNQDPMAMINNILQQALQGQPQGQGQGQSQGQGQGGQGQAFAPQAPVPAPGLGAQPFGGGGPSLTGQHSRQVLPRERSEAAQTLPDRRIEAVGELINRVDETVNVMQPLLRDVGAGLRGVRVSPSLYFKTN